MKIEQFKNARAEELRKTAEILEQVFSSDIDTFPIRNAADSLVNDVPTLKDNSTNSNYWGYSIDNLKIPVQTTRHLKPKQIDGKKIELILNMSIVADFREWDNLSDPLLELNFNVVIRGIGINGSHFTCFHLDRHDLSKPTEEPHPVYHIQFTNNPNKDPNFDFGQTMILDTPRIIHHPIEFILGIGFLTSNFFPTAYQLIMSDSFFPSIYKRYQEKILKPYFHTMSSYWNDYNPSNITWDSRKLCPSLL